MFNKSYIYAFTKLFIMKKMCNLGLRMLKKLTYA
jgi:hypothetical protein